MTSSERMTCLVDRNVCNCSVWWTSVVMVSVSARFSGAQAVA